MDSSATEVGPAPIHPGRWLLFYVAGVLLVVLIPIAVFLAVDPERRDLDGPARASASGRFVRLSDGYTHFDLAGPDHGPVVVLAAGTSVPYYIWDPTSSALASAGFRVLRYDYYGRGFSDRPDIAYTQEVYVRQLRELLDALAIRAPVDLVGLSFGGSVITTLAAREPSRARSLVYVDPAFRSPHVVSLLESMPRLWSFLTAIVDERFWADGQVHDFYHPERFPDWADRYRVQLQYRGFRRARWSDSVANATVDQRDELQRVGRDPRPVLVIWGREDPNVPFEFSAALLKALPRARLVPVEDAGHLPQWEQPAVVNRALISFLRPAR